MLSCYCWSENRRLRKLLGEGCANISECHHQSHGIERTGVEAEREVEVFCFFGQRMHENPTNSDHVCCLRYTTGCVAKQCSVEAAPLPGEVNRQSRQHRDRNRIGHITPESTCCMFNRDDARGERVVRDNLMALADDVCA